MKKMKMIRSTYPALLIAGIFVATLTLADDKDKPASAKKLDPKQEELLKKVEVLGTPGAGHKALEPFVGNWSAEIKCWMAPDETPVVTKGTAKSNWIMNGRFVREEFEGEFMGKPFRGLSITGYDNVKQRFNNVWIDDMHTAIFTTEGEAGSDDKVITLDGKYDCPITGQKDKPMKQVLRLVNRDKHVFEMHDPSLGQKSKTMEITYTRN